MNLLKITDAHKEKRVREMLKLKRKNKLDPVHSFSRLLREREKKQAREAKARIKPNTMNKM